MNFKNKFFFILIITFFSISYSQFSGGSGAPEDPYHIATAADLDNIRNYKTSSFIQTANIDLGVAPWYSGEGWDPIGDYDPWDVTKSFRGNYDGGGYEINNLYINRPDENDLGLFGSIDNSIIRNICMHNFNIFSEQATIGGIVGISYDSTVLNCIIDGNIQGYSQLGLLIGFFEGNSIINCHTIGKITTVGSSVGGLVGYCFLDSLLNCSSNVDISNGDSFVGGLIGLSYGLKTARNCFSQCNISAKGSWIGGFFGAAGIIIDTPASIDNCYAKGYISSDSTSTSDRERIGGFAGQLSGNEFDSLYMEVKNCYANVNVMGYNKTGGFVGRIWDYTIIENSYSTGSISGNQDIGGFIGYVESLDFVSTSNCYWDTETSGIDSSVSGEGRTTAEMTLPYGVNTYIDWNFETVWRDDITNQNNGYPTFLWVSGIENDDEFVAGGKGFELYQNYPNPFNPVTQIRFDLKQTSNVELTVFNSKGELVRTLFHGRKDRGIHSIQFDASEFNSGIYFYKLITDDKADIRKMLLLK